MAADLVGSVVGGRRLALEVEPEDCPMIAPRSSPGCSSAIRSPPSSLATKRRSRTRTVPSFSSSASPARIRPSKFASGPKPIARS
jgi:hypothetical protein